MPLGREVGLSRSDIVLDSNAAPLPKRGRGPQVSAHVSCGQTAGWIKMPLGMEVLLGPGHIVLDGNPPPPPPKGHSPSPNFWPCLVWPNNWMDQHATWYEGRPRSSDVVLDGDPAPPLKGAQPPVFGPRLLWPNGWMAENAAWYESRPRPRPHSVRQGPSSPRERGTAAPSFRPISIVATVAHLSYC